jgi:hypothetical protein
VADRLQAVGSLLSSVETARVRLAGEELTVAAARVRAAGSGTTVADLEVLATDLEAAAVETEAATGQPAREALHTRLSATRVEAVDQLAHPAVSRVVGATVLAALSAEIDNAAPTYGSEQRAVIEGRQDLPEHFGKRDYEVRDVARPGLDAHPRGLQELLAESRRLLGHPYDDSEWWYDTVRQHIRRHGAQIATDIAARNSGVPVLRRPGEAPAGHGH